MAKAKNKILEINKKIFDYLFSLKQELKNASQKELEKIIKFSQKNIGEDKLTTKTTIKQGYFGILSWFFGVIFTLAGLTSLPDTLLIVVVGLILMPPISKYIENKINAKKLQVKNFEIAKIITYIAKNFRTVKIITCITLLFICGFVDGNSQNYKSAQTYIQEREWKQAHEALITIKDYKNSKELLKEVDYNYYKEVGDKFYESKNYDEALKNYRNAKTGFNDADIEQKITKTSSELEAKKKHDAQVQEAFKKAQQAKIANLKKQMRIKYDKVENTTWYYDKTFPNYANQKTFDLYMGESEGSRWLRLKITFAANDWLFFNKVIVNMDGSNVEKSFNDFEINREVVSGGGIYETIDIPYQGNEYLIDGIPHAKNVTVRFIGKHHYYDMPISNAKKQAIQRIIELYDTLNAYKK